MIGQWLAVFIGGGLGSLIRFALSRAFVQDQGDFPVATFLANLIASFALGFAWEVFARKLGVPPGYRLLVMTGFCGGLSTFSTFSFETLRLMESGAWLMAAGYAALSVVVSIAMVWLGSRMGNSVYLLP